MRHPERAAVTALACLAAIALLWGGAWPCPTAKIFHIPCPGCGSTRAVQALLTGDFAGILVNPFGLLAAVAIGLLAIRGIGLEYTDGNMLRLDRGWGAFVSKALVVVAVLEIALWVVRWFGLFGGPVPV